MPIEQMKIHPVDLEVQTGPPSGGVWLHYRAGDSKAISIELSAELLASTLLSLLVGATKSEDRKTREAAQLFAIRELHAKVLPGPLLVLEQELECGASMKLTLNSADAARLVQELQSGLEVVRQSGSSSTH